MALFLLMELLETWLGWIPGFYAFYIATTLYLMLPMFNGAEKVFRKVLVPLARLQDMLLLRDAVDMKKRIVAELDEEQGKAVKRAIVEYYDDENKDAAIDERALEEYRQTGFSWKNVPVLGSFMGGGGKKPPAAENDKEDEKPEGAADDGTAGDDEKKQQETTVNANETRSDDVAEQATTTDTAAQAADTTGASEANEDGK